MFQAIVILAGIGIVQIYRQVKAKDNEGALVIAVALLAGLIAGLTHFDGLDLNTALTLALGAVGVHTVAKQVG